MMHRRAARSDRANPIQPQDETPPGGPLHAKLRRIVMTAVRAVGNHPRMHPLFKLCIFTLTITVLLFPLKALIKTPTTSTTEPQPSTWLIGVAKVNITPTERVWLSGYSSRNRTADTTTPLNPSTPLYARALSITLPNSTAASRLVIVALDLIGLDGVFSDRIHAALHSAHGLHRTQVHLISSHTHSGPVVARNLFALVPENTTEWRKIDRYAEVLLSYVVGVVGEALREDGLRACTMLFANGRAMQAVNRRQVAEKEFDGVRRGETDDSLPVMWFVGGDERVVAGMFGYAGHATVLTENYRYSGDYPGETCAGLEKRYDGATWLFLAGCGGDQNLYPRGGEAEMRAHASALVRAVVGVVERDEVIVRDVWPSGLSLRRKLVPLRFEKRLSRREVRQLVRSGRATDRRAGRMLLRGLGKAGQTLETYAFPVAGAGLGSVKMVFLGGEPTVGFCGLVRAGGADWVVGYVDDVMGYVATDDARREGGREGGERAALYYGLPGAWEFGSGGRVVAAGREVVAEL